MEVGRIRLIHIGEAERDAAERFRPEAGGETIDFCCARDHNSSVWQIRNGGSDDISMDLGIPQD